MPLALLYTSCVLCVCCPQGYYIIQYSDFLVEYFKFYESITSTKFTELPYLEKPTIQQWSNDCFYKNVLIYKLYYNLSIVCAHTYSLQFTCILYCCSQPCSYRQLHIATHTHAHTHMHAHAHTSHTHITHTHTHTAIVL